jgi:hypothetical protein
MRRQSHFLPSQPTTNPATEKVPVLQGDSRHVPVRIMLPGISGQTYTLVKEEAKHGFSGIQHLLLICGQTCKALLRHGHVV